MTSKANNWNQNLRNEDRKDDKPPYSRLFIVCGKSLQEKDLRDHFEQFGEVEDLFIPRDRNSGESRGVAYIKYSTTSAAAAAIEKFHMKTLGNGIKPIKVLVAASRNDDGHSTDEKKYKRLFIKVHREATESDIRQHFSAFGNVESVHLQRDKVTDTCKGFAYVNYTNFLGAAIAFEQCDRKYRPVFATPKEELKRSRNSLEGGGMNYSDDYYLGKDSSMNVDHFNYSKDIQHKDSMISLIKTTPMSYDTVNVTCSPPVPQKHVEQLFNIIPGMLQCHYTEETYNGFCKASVTYDCEKAAVFAVERLNNFEFPSGEIVSVKPQNNSLNKAANNLSNLVNSLKNSIDTGSPDLLQLADAIAQASSLIKAATSSRVESKAETLENYCSVNLPAIKPMASSNSRVAQRCFLVCKPYPPPLPALRDAFCRFGDLIDISILPNKNFGFAKYATASAAQEAIKTLNDVILCGVRLKVVKADEKPSKDDDKMHVEDDHNENYSDHDKDIKRMKLNDLNFGV